MKSAAVGRTLKGHVFPKVRKPLLVGALIAASYVQNYAAVGDLCVCYLPVNKANTIRKSEEIVLRFAGERKFLQKRSGLVIRAQN